MDSETVAFLVGVVVGGVSIGFIVFMMMYRGGEADGF
jgi:hypothetical protein